MSCLEVTMPQGDRVDMLTYRKRSNTFECYEFKVSKSDMHSPCALSFVGDRNYICVPVELVAEAEKVVGNTVGIIAVRSNSCKIVRKAKRIDPILDHETLMYCLMRSLQGRYDTHQLFTPNASDERLRIVKEELSSVRKELKREEKSCRYFQKMYHCYDIFFMHMFYLQAGIQSKTLVSEAFLKACRLEDERLKSLPLEDWSDTEKSLQGGEK